MAADSILREARQLSVSERMLLAADLWDTVAPDAAELPLSDDQRAELDRRFTAYEDDPNAGSSWSEVRERIQRSDS